jgi:hypothetical protein
MKTSLLFCFLLLITGAGHADQRASIVILPAAVVSGDTFTLADIATVTTADTMLRMQLMRVPMGRCPLNGLTRPFNEGDVCLKLRQAGIDPETLTISGATDLTLTGSSTSPVSQTVLPAVLAPTVPSLAVTNPSQAVIHSGDKVTLIYDDDGMEISADVVATSSGAAGQMISLQRDGATHSLQGIVEDAHTVKMVE